MNHNPNTNITYDIIGDVHGHYSKLTALLEKLGYAEMEGVWVKKSHKAVFVGDLIDKGPEPAAVLSAVRSMVEAGAAMMVIGNHELNWIQDAADHEENVTAFFQATDRHHCRRKLTAAFKHQPAKLVEIFQWLRSQPLYIDQEDIRVVHACWNDEAIRTLKNSGISTMSDKALAGYRDLYSDIYLAIDRIVAGCAHLFPSHMANNPKFRSIRKRIQWWPESNVAINPIELQPVQIDQPIPDSNKAPVFFGHYAMIGTPDLLGENVAGVDFSAAYGGPLTAYRHVPGASLNRQQFVT